MSYSYQVLQAPSIDLNIPRSPLLSSTLTNNLRISRSPRSGSSSPRTFCPASPNPGPSTTLSTRLQLLAKHQQQCIGLRLPPRSPRPQGTDKPLPSLPIPPRQIISVLELLERMDNDVMKEVQRVKVGIAEAPYVHTLAHNQHRKKMSTATANATTTNPMPPMPRRSSSLDPQVADKVERHLQQRPPKDELIDRNILKDDNVAPALQAARDKLQRSQLEDKLDHALQQRPKREELVKDHILQE
ncbi:hypothetical protein EIP91_006650 [Steccherinum ochraceum]|uniref:RPEL repeat protein n=1 Tax=Steccherinum ochraceum TaxID=92696 RepID=A0A4R0RJX7_9APHY|nr:hypothetical protein EIP91_006650 [Steccherinum ochraceum]